jgi:drug/metabolite transporter (DMT)-like permease
MPLLGEAMALGCALSWAVAVLLFRAIGPIDSRGLNLFKNTAAVVLLLLTMALTGRTFDWHRSGSDWLLLAGSAVLGITIGDSLFFAGLQRIGANLAAVTDCVYAPVVVALSVLVLHEPVTHGLLVGAPLVALGLVVVTWQKPGAAAVDRLGIAYAVGGVLVTAVGVVMAKPVLERSDLVEATTARLIVAAVTLVPVQLLTGRGRATFALFKPQPLWRKMLPACVVGPYVSMLLWLGGLKYAPVSRAALLNQMATVFLLLLSRFVGHEVIPKRRWAGALLALSGALCVLAG